MQKYLQYRFLRRLFIIYWQYCANISIIKFTSFKEQRNINWLSFVLKILCLISYFCIIQVHWWYNLKKAIGKTPFVILQRKKCRWRWFVMSVTMKYEWLRCTQGRCWAPKCSRPLSPHTDNGSHWQTNQSDKARAQRYWFFATGNKGVYRISK